MHDNLFGLVAGAKPGPVFPDGAPRLFIGAHGGIVHANRYGSCTEKWGCITNRILIDDGPRRTKLWRHIAGTNLDRLFIFESVNRRHEQLKFSDYITVKQEVIRIPRWKRTLIEFSELGLPFVINRIARGRCLLSPLASIKELIFYRTLWKTKLSMGMLSTALMHRATIPLKKIYVVGVGLSAENYGYEYDTYKVPLNGHLVQDTHLARKYIVSGPCSMEFTSNTASEYLNSLNV